MIGLVRVHTGRGIVEDKENALGDERSPNQYTEKG